MLLSELTNFCVNNEKIKNTGIIAGFEYTSNKKIKIIFQSSLNNTHALTTKRLKKISSDML